MQHIFEAQFYVNRHEMNTTPKIVKTWGVYVDIEWEADGTPYMLRMTQGELNALTQIIQLNNM